MLGYTREALAAVEADAAVSSRADALRAMRGRLGLADFGQVLMLSPLPDMPKLSRLLPAMAPDAVQDAWTGTHGEALLRQSCDFARSLAHNHARLTGRAMGSAPVLDYGCGWGRIARLMYYFAEPEDVVGLDPWDRSIAECERAGLGPNFRQSDYLPEALPVDGRSFGLAYAFSVFTHLSERAALAALAALRRSLRADGLLCITIRPVEYWAVAERMYGLVRAADMEARHARDGFAFNPHAGSGGPQDARELTYGDTSFSLDWLARAAPDWAVRGVDRSLDDPLQLYLFLTPR